jgi:hypothetical protein
MANQADPYVRVYYSVTDDERFVRVFADKTALGWWLTLLLYADAMFPASAPLPAMPKQVREILTSSGLIEVTPSGYHVHGLAAERAKRSAQGRAGASRRWSDRNANASDPQMPTHSERNANALPTQSERIPNAMHSEPRRVDMDSTNAESLSRSSGLSRVSSKPGDANGSGNPAEPVRNGRKKPDDEAEIDRLRAIVADANEPEWYREQCRSDLAYLGVHE